MDFTERYIGFELLTAGRFMDELKSKPDY